MPLRFEGITTSAFMSAMRGSQGVAIIGFAGDQSLAGLAFEQGRRDLMLPAWPAVMIKRSGRPNISAQHMGLSEFPCAGGRLNIRPPWSG